MKKIFGKAIIVFLSLFFLLVHIVYINPLFVRIANIRNIDQKELSPKIQSAAENFLGKTAEYKTRESIFSDFKTTEILQKRVGLESAAEINQTKIPTQYLKTDFYLRENKFPASSTNTDPVLSVEIDSFGAFSYLRYSSENGVSPKEVSSEIQKLFSILELSPNALQQIAPEDIRNEEFEEIKIREDEEKSPSDKKIYREIIYKQKIEGVPLASYIHKFSVGEKDVVYRRNIALKKSLIGEAASSIKDLIKVLIWFVVGFFSLAVLIIKIKRDEIDWVLFTKVVVIVSVITFLMLIFKDQFAFIMAFLILIFSFVVGAFFALIVALAESKTREIYPEQLALFDAVFQGHFRIKELGKTFFWCFIYGNFFFLIEAVFVFLPKLKKDAIVVILPPNPLEIKTSFALSLFLGNIVFPATFALFSFLIFGLLAPSFLQRSDKKWIKISAVLFFSIIACCHSTFEPFILCLILFGSLSLLFFKVWKDFGLIGIFFAIWTPLTIQRGLMLFLAKDVSIAIEGLLVLLFISCLIAAAIFLSFKGKPVSQIKTYEPLYVKKIREKERFERELEIAKHLQQKLLPQNPPSVKKIGFGMLCEPALSVGGDYFDFLEPDEGKLFVFLGDVSGKGMRAAFYMTLAKGLLHGSFNLVKDHRELLTILNKRFGALCEEGVFLTLIMLTIDCHTREILVTSAGHNPPLLFKNGEITLVPSRGLVVGPMPEEIMLNSLEEYKFKLEKGDVLLLYTDGVTEAMNPFLEEYGIERLKSVFANCVDLPAEEIMAKIRLSVLDFAAGSPLSDDLTILVLKGLDDSEK
ncbi:MAG: SpoIIE family protein phosphatase [Acidobacteriota bacterium]